MELFDSLKSFVTGLGTAKDKSTSLKFVFTPKTEEELNAMHRSDWLARKVVDIIPNDMTREWRDWQADGKLIEAIEAVEKAPLINLSAKVALALQTARLLGGALIYIGLDGADPVEPLDIETVKAGDLRYLHVLSRYDVTPGELMRDVLSEYYGQPEFYEIAGADGAMPVKIHASRMIRFDGARVLDRRTVDQWADSVLQVVYDAVANASSAQGHIASLIPEAKLDIIYVPKLGEMTKTEQGRQTLTSRFTYANQMKSTINALVLDGTGKDGEGEKWEQKQISFAQMPELMRQYLQVAAAAADIPVTRLLGESPGGMNATGESDLRNYYDNIAARQRTELTPSLHRLDEVIIRSATGKRDPSIYYEWAPLWGLSEKEKAEIFKIRADAARTIAGTGGASPPLMPIEALSDALVNALVEAGDLPGLEGAIEEFGRLADQEEDEDPKATLGVEPPVIPAAKIEGGRQDADRPFVDARRKAKHNFGGRKGFDPNQPRGEGGRWVPTGRSVETAIGGMGKNGALHVPFAAVTRPAALSKTLGADVRGFRHSLSNQSLAHAKKQHPDLGSDDYRRIPAIVRTGQPERVEPAPNGSPRVRYEATVDGVTYRYVAEVRRKQRRLDMVTFYRR